MKVRLADGKVLEGSPSMPLLGYEILSVELSIEDITRLTDGGPWKVWDFVPHVLDRAAYQPKENDMHNIQSPRTDDSAIEQEIKAKGKTAPRITPADIEANIASEHYFTAAQGVAGQNLCADDADDAAALTTDSPLHLLTFCVLVLRNGFTVTGWSKPVVAENFDAEIGRKLARAKAIEEIWPLMGYELRCRLHEAEVYSDTVRKLEG